MTVVPWWRRHRTRLMVLAWAVTCAVLLASKASMIAAHDFPDVDDRMRLLEVRDWLGGQSFWDVSQHRLNPPFGGAMHWSRIVDLPLAAVIFALRPFTGFSMAEIGASVMVPLLTLAVVMLMVSMIARTLAGEGVALVAFILTGTCVVATVQVVPMRIDHHGWELVCALLAAVAMLACGGWRSGVTAGVSIAIGLQISLELLPFAASMGALAASRWLYRPDIPARERLAGFAVALAVTNALLWAVLRWPGDAAGHCDAISPPHVVTLLLIAAGVAALLRFAPIGAGWRVVGLVGIAVFAAATFHAVPPHCGVDAFGNLEPIVRRYWYDRVPEGLPVWRQTPLYAVGVVAFPMVGLGCATLGWLRAGNREQWTGYILLLFASTLVAVTVERAGALANALAVPAAAWAMVRLVTTVQTSASAAIRVSGTCLAIVVLSPWAPAAVADALIPAPVRKTAISRECVTTAAVVPLAALASGPMLATIDLAPAILLGTRHEVLASGHHRNHAAMAEALRAFLGSQDTARAVIRRHGLHYVAFCPDQSEMTLYRKAAPAGFAARLAAGRVPAWLAPVPLPDTPVRVWRVVG